MGSFKYFGGGSSCSVLLSCVNSVLQTFHYKMIKLVIATSISFAAGFTLITLKTYTFVSFIKEITF